MKTRGPWAAVPYTSCVEENWTDYSCWKPALLCCTSATSVDPCAASRGGGTSTFHIIIPPRTVQYDVVLLSHRRTSHALAYGFQRRCLEQGDIYNLRRVVCIGRQTRLTFAHVPLSQLDGILFTYERLTDLPSCTKHNRGACQQYSGTRRTGAHCTRHLRWQAQGPWAYFSKRGGQHGSRVERLGIRFKN